MATKPTQTQKLDALGLDAICEKIVGGMMQNEVARELGVSDQAMITWLAADPERSARAREARAQSAAAYDTKAAILIEQAADPFELSRAKELAHHLRWRSSKISPRDYGDKLAVGGAADLPPVQSNVTVDAGEAYKLLLAGGVKPDA